MTTTRGRGRTRTLPRPIAASRAICGGPRTVPAVQGAVASPYVAALGAHVRACFGGPVHVHLSLGALGGEAAGAHAGHRALAEASVGPLDGDDGLGAGRQRGAGHDAGGLSGADVQQFGMARRDIPDDVQDGRELLARARHVGDPDRVPVHGAVVERRQ